MCWCVFTSVDVHMDVPRWMCTEYSVMYEIYVVWVLLYSTACVVVE